MRGGWLIFLLVLWWFFAPQGTWGDPDRQRCGGAAGQGGARGDLVLPTDTKFVDACEVNTVDPALVEVNEKDDICCGGGEEERGEGEGGVQVDPPQTSSNGGQQGDMQQKGGHRVQCGPKGSRRDPQEVGPAPISTSRDIPPPPKVVPSRRQPILYIMGILMTKAKRSSMKVLRAL